MAGPGPGGGGREAPTCPPGARPGPGTMKCVIAGGNVKGERGLGPGERSVPAEPCLTPHTLSSSPVLGRAVHSLSRIGDELYLEPTESGVCSIGGWELNGSWMGAGGAPVPPSLPAGSANTVAVSPAVPPCCQLLPFWLCLLPLRTPLLPAVRAGQCRARNRAVPMQSPHEGAVPCLGPLRGGSSLFQGPQAGDSPHIHPCSPSWASSARCPCWRSRWGNVSSCSSPVPAAWSCSSTASTVSTSGDTAWG